MPKFLTKSEKQYLYRTTNYNGKIRYVKLKESVYKSNVNHLSKFEYYDNKFPLSEEEIINVKYHLKVMEIQKEKNRVLRYSELKNIYYNLKN